MGMREDRLVANPELLLQYVPDFSELLTMKSDKEELEILRKHERTGRPLGDKSFLDSLSSLLDRDLTLGKPGRKPKTAK